VSESSIGALASAPAQTKRAVGTDLLRRFETGVLGVTSGVALLSVVVLATAHVADRYQVNHVSGSWMALAQDARSGDLYPRLFDGTFFGGTRSMPLPVLLHAGGAVLTGEYLVSGKLVAYATALALFGLVFLLLRRMGCSRLVAAALVSAVAAAPAGLLAATSIRGDALSVLFQLAAVALVARSTSPRTVTMAGLLCAVGVVSKLDAVWAPASILLWLAVLERRRLAAFFGSFGFSLVALLGLFELLSHGRMSTDLRELIFAGEAGGSFSGGASTLVHLAILDRDTVWLLLPFALLAAARGVARARVTLWQVALAVDTVLLVGVFTDPGADFNHLLDLTVLTVLVVGELWVGATVAGRRVSLLTSALAVAVVAGTASSYVRDIGPDLRPTLNMLTGRGTAARYAPHPLAGIVGSRDRILSEDPYVPISLGQRPIVVDPFMIIRMGHRHPAWIASLRRRLDEREFDKVILLFRLDPSSSHYTQIDFGRTISQAIARNYRLGRYVYAGKPGYWVYVRRLGVGA
jgi:hypothetical protein